MLAEEHGGLHILSVCIGLKFLVGPIGKQVGIGRDEDRAVTMLKRKRMFEA